MDGLYRRGCARHGWAPDGFVLLLVLRVKGPPLWQTNAKCITVNGKILGVIASQGLKSKGNLHTINGHQLVSLCLPSTCDSRPQKLCKAGFRQCSRQRCSKYR